MNTCPHGAPLGACLDCETEIRRAMEPPAELAPMRAWVDQSRGELRELARICGGWPHLHNDLVAAIPAEHPSAAAMIAAADPITSSLFNLAYCVEDGNAEGEEQSLGLLAIALLPLNDAPHFGITAARNKRAKPDERASSLASRLILNARRALVTLVAAFVALEAPGAAIGEG